MVPPLAATMTASLRPVVSMLAFSRDLYGLVSVKESGSCERSCRISPTVISFVTRLSTRSGSRSSDASAPARESAAEPLWSDTQPWCHE